ncbi:Prolyl endopeptidase [Fusarium keratoplasticum]|uniref:Prolyl endopeptidase n=1 Tax=Fusarium keratoplasticum TaxID=1328300 RepID=A0ACC0QU65_9HYPO|nr:Prolyl endopeptidase [Fusarium keratoplasticum]KAI8666689.1 Prolyl endopeptidase [Fusarium keratoplasticum]KAI8668386.1 Prolyl endopeptidase [Fusarium keratoplasticum]
MDRDKPCEPVLVTNMPIKPDSDYEWLETQESPEGLEWVDNQNELATRKLDSLPHTKSIQEKLVALSSTDVNRPSYWITGNLFRLRKDSTNKHGILEVSERHPDGSLGDWRLILDIDKLGREESRELEFFDFDFQSRAFGPDASRLLVLLSDGGSDLVELRELDTKQGKFVRDGFRTGLGRIAVTWLDIDHVLINHNLNGSPTTAAGWGTTSYIWKRGTDLKEAKAVKEISPTSALSLISSVGQTNSGRALITCAVDYSTLVYSIVSLDGTVEELDLPKKQSMSLPPKTTSKHVVAVLGEKATVCGREVPVGSVIAYNTVPDTPANERTSIVYVPEPDEVNAHLFVDGIQASKTRVYLTMNKRQSERRLTLENDAHEWRIIRSIETSIGSHAAATSGDPYSNETVVTESGLLSPSTTWLERGEAKESLYTQPSVFNADAFQLSQKSTTSKDDTSIDYLVLSPKEPKHPHGEQPIMMIGYGAFGLSVPLSYLDMILGGISLVPWLESGGSLVIPFIRGGGERGEAWHQAARQEKRQNSYDDFIAVAETLVKDGITTPKRIGVVGGSNGGLLAAVMGTQRPDLFGAIVSDVPLTDMLRYPLMGMGAAWIYEYGDPQNPEMAKVLRAYSPFHNIREGIQYPPFLVTVSTKDDRVGAGHARKLVARLKDAGASDVFLYEDRTGGHGVSDPFKNATLMARRVAFLIEFLQPTGSGA